MTINMLIREITVNIVSSNIGKPYLEKELNASLRRYSERTLAKLNSIVSDHSKFNPVMIASISSAVQKQVCESRLLDMIDYLPTLYSLKPNIWFCTKALLSLNDYRKRGWIPRFTEFHTDPAIPLFLITCEKLCRSLIASYEKQGYDTLSREFPDHVPFRLVEPIDENPVFFVLKDEWLVRLIMEHEEDSDVIIDLLCERGSDYELLTRILGIENKALTSGLL